MNNWKKILLFLAGTFSMTQIQLIGYIGITELFFFILAPFVFWKNSRLLIQHGFMPALALVLLWGSSAVLTDWIRHNTLVNLAKGAAAPYAIFSGIVVLHALLWDDLGRFKWAVLGVAISTVLSVYVFQYGAYAGLADSLGLSAEEATKEYKMYGIIMLSNFLTLPVKTLYMRIPKYISIGLLLFLAVYSLFEGGRSVFLVRLLSVVIIFLGGRKVSSMRAIPKNFFLVAGLMIMAIFCATAVYKTVVLGGGLGETELEKYEAQSSSRIGLLSGRSEFVSALWAIKESPLIGHGSWAIDYPGYQLRAVELIGTDKDIDAVNAVYASGVTPWIPCHSYVWQSWVWHGVAGGIFWMYIFYVLFKTFKACLGTIPPLFGYFAVTLPVEFWNVWFSPLGQRVEVSMLIALCLLVIAQEKIRKGAMRYQEWRG